MRKILAVLLIALAACGADKASGPAMGKVRFTRDANTCSGSPVVFTFFSDGSTLGSATLAAGASQEYPVTATTHAFSVQVTNSTFRFSNVIGTVPDGGIYTYLMVCQ